MLLIMYEVENLHGSKWLQECWTGFADDIHLGTPFSTPEEFDVARRKIGSIIHLLRGLGLTVNAAKTNVIVAFAGSAARRVSAATVLGSKNKATLIIPLPDGSDMQLPLVQSAPYLGVIMSYTDHARLSVDHRSNTSRSAFARLHRWLTSRTLSKKTRLSVWMTCIKPTLLYGLMALDLANADIHRLQQELYRQLRRVFNDHSFVARRSHHTQASVL